MQCHSLISCPSIHVRLILTTVLFVRAKESQSHSLPFSLLLPRLARLPLLDFTLLRCLIHSSFPRTDRRQADLVFAQPLNPSLRHTCIFPALIPFLPDCPTPSWFRQSRQLRAPACHHRLLSHVRKLFHKSRPRPRLLCACHISPLNVFFSVCECTYLIVDDSRPKCLSFRGKRTRRRSNSLPSTVTPAPSQDGKTHGSGRESTPKRSQNSCMDAQLRSSREVCHTPKNSLHCSTDADTCSLGCTLPTSTLSSLVRP